MLWRELKVGRAVRCVGNGVDLYLVVKDVGEYQATIVRSTTLPTTFEELSGVEHSVSWGGAVETDGLRVIVNKKRVRGRIGCGFDVPDSVDIRQSNPWPRRR